MAKKKKVVKKKPVPAPKVIEGDEVKCLGYNCERTFISPDKTRIRLCPKCKKARELSTGLGRLMERKPVNTGMPETYFE